MKRINSILGYPDLKVVQNTDSFSFSLDSIILANYSSIRLRDKKIVDFCSGNTVIPIILSQRCDKHIDAVEVQESIYQMGLESISLNHLEDRISLFCEDIKDFSSKHLNEYDLVLCNPPYFKNCEKSTKNISYEKMIARHEILINLDEVCKCASLVLKENGNFCIIHRVDRFIDIISSFRKYHIEPKRVKFIYENVNKESYMVFVEGQKAGSVGLKVDKPLILYNDDGSYTDEYESLQREVLK